MKRHRMWFFEGDAGGGSGGGSLLSGADSGQQAAAGAGEQQQTAQGFVGADGSFVEGWTGKLPEELGDARQGFAKFKTVADLARSYHGLESRLGSKATFVEVPGEGAKPEVIAAYRKAIGVPESVEGYKDLKPAQLPEGVEWSDENVKPYLEIAHKHNITPAAMQELIKVQLAQEVQRGQAVEAVAKQQLAQGQEALKKAWGESYEKNIGLAASAAKMAGVDPASPGFADPEVVKAFARLGSMVGEDKIVQSDGGQGFQSPKARATDIMTNSQHPLYRKYQEGDPETVDMVRGLLQRAA